MNIKKLIGDSMGDVGESVNTLINIMEEQKLILTEIRDLLIPLTDIALKNKNDNKRPPGLVP